MLKAPTSSTAPPRRPPRTRYPRSDPKSPETKAATSTGDPVLPGTRGLLAPPTITAIGIDRIGKEAKRLADDQLLDGADDEPVLYTVRTCRGCQATVAGKRRWCSDACRKRAARRAA
jgi:hypothetical protein